MRTKPNKAHEVLAEWTKRFPGMTLITQNVDGLHQEAGALGTIEMHGSIQRLICFDKRHPAPWPDTLLGVPECQVCGSKLRPDIVWFGENLDRQVLGSIDKALKSCELFFAIGTSGLVYPAARFLKDAKSHGAVTIIINKEALSQGTADIQVQGSASEVLEGLNAGL